MNADGEHLIKLYNELMGKVNAKNRGFITFNQKNRDLAVQLDAFLGQHDLQAGPYITACFARYRWRRWPKFHELTSLSNLRNYRDTSVEAHSVFRTVALNRGDTARPLVPKGLEIVRQRLYDQGPEFCMPRTSLHGGHNPHSPICQGCPKAQECARVQ